tara:strand:+ start:127824 stop:129077 length:1254 start_codon:yes stop_codon:yes gene_type:complete
MALGLFSKKDQIDKYWDKFSKVLSNPTTTAKNVFIRLHNTTLLPGGMPLEFEHEEQAEFAARYGVEFCDLLTDAITQGKISIDFVDVLLHDYMNIEEMGYVPLEQEAFRRAYTNFVHVGLERYFSSVEDDKAAGECFAAQNKVLYDCMMDDSGDLTADEVEQFILKQQDLAYQAKGKDDAYSELLFYYVENLMEDREETGLSERCLYELIYKALFNSDVYGNGLLLKALNEASPKEQSLSSEPSARPLIATLIKHIVESSEMAHADKAWLAYVLRVYCDVECENIDVIKGRYNLVDHNVDPETEESKLSAVCVCFNAGASKNPQQLDGKEKTYVFFTKNTTPPCEVLQHLQDIRGEEQGERLFLIEAFNKSSSECGVYEYSDYKKSLPQAFGESGALLLERIKDEQHLKKLQKLTIH